MKRMILVCWLCLVATSAYADNRQKSTPKDEDIGCWISFDKRAVMSAWAADRKTGCQVLLSNIPGLSVNWSGSCKDGKAYGHGELKIYGDKKIIFTVSGKMENGACHDDCSVSLEGISLKYIGELQANIFPHGKGVSTYDDLTCSGEWENGKMNGRGAITYPGISYTGTFKDGKFNGDGTMLYKNGDKYSGGWSEGKRHGKGTYTFKDGTSYEGLWERGERIKIF